jgi:hypothetical protein
LNRSLSIGSQYSRSNLMTRRKTEHDVVRTSFVYALNEPASVSAKSPWHFGSLCIAPRPAQRPFFTVKKAFHGYINLGRIGSKRREILDQGVFFGVQLVGMRTLFCIPQATASWSSWEAVLLAYASGESDTRWTDTRINRR